MRHDSANRLRVIAIVVAGLGSPQVLADALQVSAISPRHLLREGMTLDVSIVGRGFNSDAGIRFLLTGTEKPGGITVQRVAIVSAQKLFATVTIDPEVKPGYFDVEISNDNGEKAIGKHLLFVQPYSWAARFGCTGAESWRLRVPCKRGSVN